jgi:hypothetical protein
MPLSLHVYRLVGSNPEPIEPVSMDGERRLQEILANRIDIIDPSLMVIGREVQTAWSARIDILAINSDGHLVVIELKRDRTPREVVAQALEYGSWVRGLDNAAVAEQFGRYLKQYRPADVQQSLDESFRAKFGVELPEELNAEHELLIVAAELDAGTERIVEYLTEVHGVPVNVVFFRLFKDAGHEYLTRAWLREPDESGEVAPARAQGEWNGEFYANFGHGEDRNWEDARKYGFISAGGGDWYTRPLRLLAVGSRVWVNVPGRGYVGVGKILGPPARLSEFTVGDRPFLDLRPTGRYMVPLGGTAAESSEVFVPVQWLHTTALHDAVKERGFYGNQWTVTQSTQPKWKHTVGRLKAKWGVSDES